MIPKDALRELSKKNLTTAERLVSIDADAAVLHAGLALELGLKYKICELWRIPELPDTPDAKYSNDVKTEDSIRKAIKTHNFRSLIYLAGFDQEIPKDENASYALNEVEKCWNDDIKYRILGFSEEKALDYINQVKALTDYIEL